MKHKFRGKELALHPVIVRRYTVADPGFLVGGAWTHWGGGHGLPTQALFGKNVCQNERIGSCSGGGGGSCTGHAPRSVNVIYAVQRYNLCHTLCDRILLKLVIVNIFKCPEFCKTD